MVPVPEVAAVGQALSSVKLALDLVKSIRGTSKALDEAELKLQIAELLEALSNAKIQLVEAQGEILSLQARIRELEAPRNLRSKLERRDGVYFLKEKVEGRDEGPYCPGCFDAKGSLISLSRLPKDFEDAGKYMCPQCQQPF